VKQEYNDKAAYHAEMKIVEALIKQNPEENSLSRALSFVSSFLLLSSPNNVLLQSALIQKLRKGELDDQTIEVNGKLLNLKSVLICFHRSCLIHDIAVLNDSLRRRYIIWFIGLYCN